MSETRRFIDLCLSGEALLEEIDDVVDRWHEAPQGSELHEYLGMTPEEYSLWLRVPDALPYIIAARHQHRSLSNAVLMGYEEMRLAARSNDQAKIVLLQQWLKAKGEVS